MWSAHPCRSRGVAAAATLAAVVVGLARPVAGHACSKEQLKLCSSSFGPALGDCLKEKASEGEISEECEAFMGVHEACVAEVDRSCKKYAYTDQAMTCLAQWTDATTLSADCLKTLMSNVQKQGSPQRPDMGGMMGRGGKPPPMPDGQAPRGARVRETKEPPGKQKREPPPRPKAPPLEKKGERKKEAKQEKKDKTMAPAEAWNGRPKEPQKEKNPKQEAAKKNKKKDKKKKDKKGKTLSKEEKEKKKQEEEDARLRNTVPEEMRGSFDQYYAQQKKRMAEEAQEKARKEREEPQEKTAEEKTKKKKQRRRRQKRSRGGKKPKSPEL